MAAGSVRAGERHVELAHGNVVATLNGNIAAVESGVAVTHDNRPIAHFDVDADRINQQVTILKVVAVKPCRNLARQRLTQIEIEIQMQLPEVPSPECGSIRAPLWSGTETVLD